MFERAPGLNFSVFGLCRCAAAQFQMAGVCMWLVELEISENACSESNSIGRQREVCPSDEAETILIFW